MRVLHVTTVAQTLDRLFPAWVSFLDQKGCTQIAACGASQVVDLPVVSRKLGCRIVRLPMKRQWDLLADVRTVLALVLLIRETRPDILHVHTPKAGFLGAVAWGISRRRRTTRLIYTVRGAPHLTLHGIEKRLVLCAEWVTCKVASRVLFVSRSLADEYERNRIVRVGKADVPHFGSGQGVDAQRFSPSRVTIEEKRQLAETLRISLEAPVALFVGRLTGDKGLVELAEAWTMVEERIPTAQLIVVGNVDEDRKRIVPEWEYLDDRLSVRYVGRVADVVPYYALADVHVLPSHREGFPNVALEASAMAVPTVGFDVVGTRDAIRNGETGWIVPLSDSNQFGRQLVDALASPRSSCAMGERARAWVVSDFRPEDVFRAVFGAYRS